MGHGSVAEEIKRRRGERKSRIVAIEEEGVRFRSYLQGEERFMGPETSMEIQAALGSDIALAFDECTPFHVDRDYTASSMERTHRWLDRCLAWHAENAPGHQLLFGIVQGGVHEDLRAESTAYIERRRASTGVAIGGSLGQSKEQMREVVGVVAARPRRRAPAAPARDRRRGRPDPRGRRGHRPVRLRHAHPPGAPRHRARAGPGRGAGGSTSRRARTAPAASRSPRAAAAPPAASTRAATCTTCCAPGSPPPRGC